MASPQVSNGYTRIANEILDQIICARLSGNQLAIVLLIIRESYGWNRKETGQLGMGAMAGKIGTSKAGVQAALRTIRSRGLVFQKSEQCWTFQKDYEKWVGGYAPAYGGVCSSIRRGMPQHTGGYVNQAKRVCPSIPLDPISSTSGEAPKDIKTYVKTERQTKAPSAPDLSEIVKKLSDPKNVVLYRRCTIPGRHMNREFIEIPAEDAEWMIRMKKPTGTNLLGLQARINLKKSEAI